MARRALVRLALACTLAWVAGTALGQIVPWHSPIPRPRPPLVGNPVSPAGIDAAVANALASANPAASPLAPAVSRMALPRPAGGLSRLSRALAAEPRRASPPVTTRGAICGNAALRGSTLGRIPGRLDGCGVDQPVSVTSVHGIPLSQAATMDCDTAEALARWVDRGLVPAVGRRGGGVVRLNVVAHYACRPRNNRAGARISEHGRGRAVDISGYDLRDGTTVSVLNDWRRRPHRRDLEDMYEAACGIFRTTLGPESDRYHQDHFHFDLARHRNGGTYCR